MTTEEKFKAAVNVIRSLPKNGSYQPSNELMLRFYAYFKQATEGANKSSKPSFWDIVGRAKWDAWSKLGEMPRQKAMESYVEELNKIVETMAYTENVADFLDSLDSFYTRVPQEELETCIGPALEKIRSMPNSPLASRDGTPIKKTAVQNASNSVPRSLSLSDMSSFPDAEEKYTTQELDDDDEDEYFLDSNETLPVRHRIEGRPYPVYTGTVIGNGFDTANSRPHDSVEDILMRTVFSLRQEVTALNEVVMRLERNQTVAKNRFKVLFGSMSKETVAFFMIWPILVHFGLTWLARKRRTT